MIDVYSWPTPNGHKVHIMLEECGLPWRVHAVNIGKGDQFEADFLAISPNNKIPAIVDPDGPDGAPISVFESGAVLLYLAGKTGRFLPADVRGKYEALQWLMFQMGGVGPMLGQAHHFRIYAPEQIDYAVNRYTNEAKRLYGVMDRQVALTGAYIAQSSGAHLNPAVTLGMAIKGDTPWSQLPLYWGCQLLGALIGLAAVMLMLALGRIMGATGVLTGAVLILAQEAPLGAAALVLAPLVAVDLGLGDGRATVWTCDLTHGYIAINADYRS